MAASSSDSIGSRVMVLTSGTISLRATHMASMGVIGFMLAKALSPFSARRSTGPISSCGIVMQFDCRPVERHVPLDGGCGVPEGKRRALASMKQVADGEVAKVVESKPIEDAIGQAGTMKDKEAVKVMRFLKEHISDHMPTVLRFHFTE